MESIRSLSTRETKRYLRITERYGGWCHAQDVNMTFHDACSMEQFHKYRDLQEITDAYFLLSKVGFEGAWRKGFGMKGPKRTDNKLL